MALGGKKGKGNLTALCCSSVAAAFRFREMAIEQARAAIFMQEFGP